MSNTFQPSASPGLHDAAFEPNAGYMFEDSGAMDHFRHDLDTPYDSNGINSGYPVRPESMPWEHQMDMSSNDTRQSLQSQGFEPLGFPYNVGNGELSPLTPAWQPTKSFMPQLPQLHMATNGHRDGGVAQQFGQVTPVTSQSRSPTSISDDAQHQQQIEQSNAKSERARNAANHRHSLTKQARELARKGRKGSADRGDDGEEDKPRGSDKQEYREKNRQAAAKCRKKKKDSTEVLENKARANLQENNRLKSLVRQLRDEYSELRTKALAHDGTEGCRCTDIHQYNAHQAQQAARDHAGSPATMVQGLQAMQAFQMMPSMQSPPGGIMPSPDMSTTSLGMPSSRAQSFSRRVRPEISMRQPHHVRVDSMHDPTMQHAATLQMGGNEFPFDQSLEGSQEDGRNGGFQ